MSNYPNNKAIYNEHKTKCCICGETSKCCLEFHHIKEKNFNISRSLKHITSLLLLDELKLTECVCKNCHSKIHSGLIKYESCSNSNKSSARNKNFHVR